MKIDLSNPEFLDNLLATDMDGQFICLYNDYSCLDISNINKGVRIYFVAVVFEKPFYEIQDQCYGN
jgi:hypothetical protein